MLIAGATPGHPFYTQAVATLPTIRSKGQLIAHTMAEAFSVLTRQKNSRPPADVLRYLDQFLGQQPIGLTPASYPKVLKALADGGIVGGSIYDGLIAAAAKQSGLRLLSLDRRAVRTYAMLDVDYEILI